MPADQGGTGGPGVDRRTEHFQPRAARWPRVLTQRMMQWAFLPASAPANSPAHYQHAAQASDLPRSPSSFRLSRHPSPPRRRSFPPRRHPSAPRLRSFLPWREPITPWSHPSAPRRRPSAPWSDPSAPWRDPSVPWSGRSAPTNFSKTPCFCVSSPEAAIPAPPAGDKPPSDRPFPPFPGPIRHPPAGQTCFPVPRTQPLPFPAPPPLQP